MWTKTSSVLLACALLTGCTTTVQRPDGTIETKAVDYELVSLMASTSVAAWAAATNGINEKDANALMNILNALESFHADGTPIEPMDWTEPIQRDVPKRYQGLALVLVDVVAYQLKKYDLNSVVPTKDSAAWKLMQALKDGAKRGLMPYLKKAA